jgi:tRNA(Ile)-lysidine synthase TilS/MesJ
MRLQQVMSFVRKAIDDYQMIEDGDRIAVGISGGKDSLTLLYALHGLMSFYPKQFTIHAVTVDLGWNNLNLEEIKRLCNSLDVPYTIVSTDIAKIIFEDRKEDNPCSLCAKMRKGALNQAIKEAGCNKVAYAHHKDDVIETMMMSLIYEGRLHTFSPVTYLDRMDLTVIRPMIYMKEVDVIGFVNKYEVPVVKSPCPVDGHTKREYIKNLIQKLNQDNPGVKERMFTAIQNGSLKGWTLEGGCRKVE